MHTSGGRRIVRQLGYANIRAAVRKKLSARRAPSQTSCTFDFSASASRFHVVAGAISLSMRFAFSISATRRSYAACRFSHERASPPK